MAATVVELQRFAVRQRHDLSVTFVYSPAEFAPPPAVPSQSLQAGPVTDEFKGRLRRSSLPIGAIIGLGYEPQRALGAFELLEPSSAWAFRPVSHNPQFNSTVEQANSQLLALLGAGSVFPYAVRSGAELIHSLESFVFVIAPDNRVVLIPMGPKIFALACLLVALDRSPERPAVWRVGEDRYVDPPNVSEDGSVVAVEATFRSTWPGLENS
jgi:hypothetical protein